MPESSKSSSATNSYTATPLNGQCALVTGASRGIGAACAAALAQRGARVILNDIRPCDETMRQVEACGGEAFEARGDVADRQLVNNIVEQIVAEQGGVDILVTNAAYSDRRLFYEANLEEFQRTIDVCMWGQFNFLHAVARAMIERGQGGCIVCVSSPHAFKAIPGSMAYNMAKAATDQMARTAACELAEHRIRVNIVHPGWTDTPGERKFFSESELTDRGGGLPWGRLARPDEIGHGVAFLCDPASEYINGTTLSIDGGGLLPFDQMFRVKGRPE